MSKKPRRLTEDELVSLSCEIAKIASQCKYLDHGLKVLTASLASFVDYQVKDRQERMIVMDACILQLKKFKKQMGMRSKKAKD